MSAQAAPLGINLVLTGVGPVSLWVKRFQVLPPVGPLVSLLCPCVFKVHLVPWSGSRGKYRRYMALLHV